MRMTSHSESDLMTLQEVADRLRVHPRTVLRWDAAGKMPQSFVLAGSTRRWRRPDVLRWISEGGNHDGERCSEL